MYEESLQNFHVAKISRVRIENLEESIIYLSYFLVILQIKSLLRFLLKYFLLKHTR